MQPDLTELERRAREQLPGPAYDYYAGGSGQERTLEANLTSWRSAWLAPRVLRDVAAVDTSAVLLGETLRTPLAVAPTAFHRLAHPDGEVATAIGTARAGALFVLSGRSTRLIEEVGAACAEHGGTWWKQVYLMRDRELTAGLARRAAAAGAKAIVLTADTPVVGRKRRDSDDGVVPDEDMLINLGPVADMAEAYQSASVTFADIGWLAEISGLPVVVKGVLRADDALACADAGAAAVIVSNHGGRQLDGAIPAAYALPGIAAGLRNHADGPAPGAEVYADGGIRTGEDALTAIGLGARAVFLGRPVLWALACGAADGVADLLTGLTDDLAHAMALAGATTPEELAGVPVRALVPLT